MKIYSSYYGIVTFTYNVVIDDDKHTFTTNDAEIIIHGYMKDDILIPHNEIGPTWIYGKSPYIETFMFIKHGEPMLYEEFTRDDPVLKMAITIKWGDIELINEHNSRHYKKS